MARGLVRLLQMKVKPESIPMVSFFAGQNLFLAAPLPFRSILQVKSCKGIIQGPMFFLQFNRLVKKQLRCNSKKFRFVPSALGVQERFFAFFRQAAQLKKRLGKNRCPCSVLIQTMKFRRSVCNAI